MRALLNTMMLALAAATNAMAGDTAIDTGDSTLVIGEIAVTAAKSGPLPTRSVLSSVDILGADKIENQNVLNSWQLFSQMPGIQLTEFRQGAESGKLSFRAFNGEGEINAIKLLIDGVPSNTNDGNMRYMDMVFPLDLEALEVVRGTNDARYGLHNIAGNVNMVTKQGGNYLHARASAGSFNTREAQVSAGIENNSFAQNYFAAWQDTDGYRDHANSHKYSLAGKWFFTTDDNRYKLGLIARHYRHEADEPGYMTYAETKEDKEQSMPRNATDQGKRRMNQVSAHFDASLTERLSFAAKTYLNKYEDSRWVTFYSSQQERVTDERHVGTLTTLTWRPQVASIHALALEGGLSTERQDNRSERYSTVKRMRTAQTRDQQFDFDTDGGYVQAVIQPIASLKFIPAYRVDRVTGDYTNLLTNTRYDANDYGLIRQPKFSVVYSPLDAYSLYGNWGRTFQVGVGTATYKVNQSNDLEPSINQGWETGLKFHPVKWMDGRVAIWKQVAANEARRKLGDASNDSENIGKTERRGLDLQFNLTPTDKSSLWLAWSWQDSEILKADDVSRASQGKEIDHVPHYIFSGGADYQVAPQWKLALTAHGQGDYYLERTNSTGKFGDYLLFNASGAYQYNKQISLDFQVRNLTGRAYEYVWHDGTRSLHAPGDGRAAYLAVNLKY